MIDFSKIVREKVAEKVNKIQDEIEERQKEVANKLIANKNIVLSGGRSGREYINPATGKPYIASAPHEAPAYRTGEFYKSFQKETFTSTAGCNKEIHAQIYSTLMVESYNLGKLFEEGTDNMEKREFAEKILDETLPEAVEILRKPYK